MQRLRLYVFLSTLILPLLGTGQYRPAGRSNQVITSISTRNQPQVLDSFSLVPGTFQMPGVPEADYRIDAEQALLWWIRRPDRDSVRVLYRRFPFRWDAPTYRYRYDSIRYFFRAGSSTTTRVTDPTQRQLLFTDVKGLSVNGSIGRSLAFGNSQDAVVNSAMNLQVSGFLSDSLELTAAVSDNALPLQPDGNTRDLRDFDRIFLQLRKKGTQVSFGDIDLRETRPYFLRFYKRLQGVSFSDSRSWGRGWQSEASFSGAVARGKFNRQVVTPTEGNQGPYRLQGANNELYFIVLAGTERVFIDGMMLQRGEDQDYVINYNTAEITFTPRQQISRDKRIQVEFEYADRNYLNTQFYATAGVSRTDRFRMLVSAFSNADSRNNTLDQPLSDEQKQLLGSVGDSVQNAFFSSAVPDTFSTGKILYRKIDTLYNGTLRDSVYVFSQDASQPLYAVSFTYVGPGKGHYRPLLNALNGKVFEWISPDLQNQPRGDYAPVVFLVAPKKLQVVSLSLGGKLGRRWTYQGEGAFSVYDVNLFSAMGSGDRPAFAGKMQVAHQSDSIRISRQSLTWTNSVTWERVSARFKPPERLRNVEFFRDWSLPFDTPPADEQILSASTALAQQGQTPFRYEYTRYDRSDGYRGQRHLLGSTLLRRQWRCSTAISLLDVTAPGRKARFFRPYTEWKHQWKPLKGVEWGGSFTGEYNRNEALTGDSLLPGSFGFSRGDLFVRSRPDAPNKWVLGYYRRVDLSPRRNQLAVADLSDNISVGLDWLKHPRRQLRSTVSYRNFQVRDSSLSTGTADKALLGRWEYEFQEAKGMLTGGVFYELGGGQEQKREFSYLAVPAGQGTHTWIDYNGNGLEELNEFEPAVFPDQRRYIRIFTPSNQLVRTRSVQFNYHLEIQPAAGLQGKRHAWLKRISLNAALQAGRKNLADERLRWNPFQADLADTALIQENFFLSHAFFYNRNSSRWGFELNQSLSKNKTLLTYGYESRVLSQYGLRIRRSLNRSWLTQFSARYIVQELGTTGVKFGNRNYLIVQPVAEPSVTYLYKSVFRAVFSYAYAQKQNQIDSMERVSSHSFSGEVKYNALSRFSITGRLTYQQLTFDAYSGAANSTVGFVMLEGLQPGKNMLWSAELTRRLGGNLEISIQYEGRMPSGARAIHTGRATARAVF